jgi:hypothetical protein
MTLHCIVLLFLGMTCIDRGMHTCRRTVLCGEFLSKKGSKKTRSGWIEFMPSSSALNSELQFDDVRHGVFVFVFWPKKNGHDNCRLHAARRFMPTSHNRC